MIDVTRTAQGPGDIMRERATASRDPKPRKLIVGCLNRRERGVQQFNHVTFIGAVNAVLLLTRVQRQVEAMVIIGSVMRRPVRQPIARLIRLAYHRDVRAGRDGPVSAA